MLEEKKPIRSKRSEMKFGNTTYIVTTTFNEKARDTVERKFLQLVTDRISNMLNSPESTGMEGNLN